MSRSYDEGFEDGKEEGFEEGFEDGKEEGFEEGFAKGKKEGKEEGESGGCGCLVGFILAYALISMGWCSPW